MIGALIDAPQAGPEADGAADIPHVRIAIVGSGFAGLGMAIRLRQAGTEDFLVLERAEEVGGTWRDNTYPGCQCDVPSHLYSFSFAPDPGWRRTFSRRQQIQEYLRRCADEHGVRDNIRLGHDVHEAAWDDDRGRWRIETSRGTLTAQVLIGAMGGLSEPSTPYLPGMETFEGTMFHSACWDHDHDLTGERVAVVGTGASAIQFVPRIRRRAAQVHVFQRSPPWILPHTDRPVSAAERRAYQALPPLQRLVRTGIFAARDLLSIALTRPRLIEPLERLARLQLRLQVRDPELRAKLTPSYRLGCKRILVSNSWYPALTKSNVEVVTDAIREIRPRSIVTADGGERQVDTIVFGTGFAVADMPATHIVRGRGGALLGEAWQGSPQAYKGTTVTGFPNLFLLVGPNTGTGSTSQVFMIEAQIAYAIDAIRTMGERGLSRVEVRSDVQERFNANLQRRMEGTVWTAGGCGSWYLDANGRNSTLWPGFSWRFRRATRRFDPAAYNLHAGAPRAAAAA